MLGLFGFKNAPPTRLMRALVQSEASGRLQVQQLLIPSPPDGHVLVRVECTPVNRGDLALLRGKHGIKREYPMVPGFEGSGVVVESGGGLLAWMLDGKRVAFHTQQAALQGCWAEYVVVPVADCVPIDGDVSFEDAAGALVAPMTAMAMLDLAQEFNHTAAVVSAGASTVAKLFLELCRDAGIAVVCIVRRPEDAGDVVAMGAADVVDMSLPDYPASLAAAAARAKATVAFDAIAGPMTGAIVNAMPPESTIVVMGDLSDEHLSGIDPKELVYRGKRLQGLWISHFMRQKSLVEHLPFTSYTTAILKEKRAGRGYAQTVSLDGAPDAVERCLAADTPGVLLICPPLPPLATGKAVATAAAGPGAGAASASASAASTASIAGASAGGAATPAPHSEAAVADGHATSESGGAAESSSTAAVPPSGAVAPDGAAL